MPRNVPFTGEMGAETSSAALVRRHTRRIWAWLACTPGLREPGAPLGAVREVACQACGSVIGTARDPVEVALMAWQHRRTHRHRAAAA